MFHRQNIVVIGFVLFFGCAPQIGDACETSVDCDVQNKRICDTTQPGGYCTLAGCEKGTCPDEAICVMFRPEPERLSGSWCMASCENNSDCRGGYHCTKAGDLGTFDISTSNDETGATETTSVPLARSLDKASARFCSVRVEDQQ